MKMMAMIWLRGPGPKHPGDEDGQQHDRKGKEDVEDAHDDLIGLAAGVPGDQSEHRARSTPR